MTSQQDRMSMINDHTLDETLAGTNAPTVGAAAGVAWTLPAGLATLGLLAIVALFAIGVFIDCRQQRINRREAIEYSRKKRIRMRSRSSSSRISMGVPPDDASALAAAMEGPSLTAPPSQDLYQII